MPWWTPVLLCSPGGQQAPWALLPLALVLTALRAWDGESEGKDSLWWEGSCGGVWLLPLVPCSSWQFPEAGLFGSGVTP